MDLHEKAVEIAKKYEHLSVREKIAVIAQSFGCKSGEIEISPCYGQKWHGTSDMSIRFDNDVSVFLDNRRTPEAETAKVQQECVNGALLWYNPEIVAVTKEAALSALRKREVFDNAIAAQKGLKPYTLLNVEFNNGTDAKSAAYVGWYYVTLAVDSKIRAHLETDLSREILEGKVGETLTQNHYYVAGALNDAEVDYVFDNVGFSSTSTLYSLPISDDVLGRAAKTLAERIEARAAAKRDHDMHKPSIKAKLATKPVPGKQLTKPKDREAR